VLFERGISTSGPKSSTTAALPPSEMFNETRRFSDEEDEEDLIGAGAERGPISEYDSSF
jgi:hypothetical protein